MHVKVDLKLNCHLVTATHFFIVGKTYFILSIHSSRIVVLKCRNRPVFKMFESLQVKVPSNTF